MKVHEPLIVILIIIIVQNTIQSTNIAMEIGSFGSMFYLEIMVIFHFANSSFTGG